jgi:molecular chaperone GrpE
MTSSTEPNPPQETQDTNPEAPAQPAASVPSGAPVEALQDELDQLKDQFLRAKAEAENARRRAEEEMAKTRKFAVEGFAEGMLPVLDSLQAALATPQATPEQMLEGVQATLQQLLGALERHQVKPIAPEAGAKFDPHLHQAISAVPAEQEPNTVVTVLQTGYTIAERVLRPALVTVATAPK